MSVIVKNMEMPKNCKSCPLRYSSTGYAWCDITGASLALEIDMRDYTCPLVEIPTPHGRLIDAEKLMMSLADWWYSSFGEEETDEAKAIRKVLDTVEQSIGEMTVVETEGREE